MPTKQYEDMIRKMRNKTAIKTILICLFIIIMSLAFLIVNNINFIIMSGIIFIYSFGFIIVSYNLVKIGKLNYFLQEQIYIHELSKRKIIKHKNSVYIKGIYNNCETINSVKFDEKEEYVLITTLSEHAMIFKRL